MLDRLELAPGHRVLFLHIPDLGLAGEISRRLTQGVVVALGDRDAVAGARRAARELENVMFTPAPPEEIPFRDGFFTHVVDLAGGWEQPQQAAAETFRVLAGGGRILVHRNCTAHLVSLGCRIVEEADTVTHLVKPAPEHSGRPEQSGRKDVPFRVL